MRQAPIAIVGGGPAGLASAVELRRLGYPVFVIERSHYDGFRIGESVPPAARQIVAELGLSQTSLSQHSLECQGIWSAWGSEAIFEKNFIFSPYGHGWHVDRRKFDESLSTQARALGAEVLCGSKVLSCEIDGDRRWQLVFTGTSGAERRQASFLIDASGRSATVGRKLGAERAVFDQQIGIARIFSMNGAAITLEPVTLVEAAEDGWWYSAPLPGAALIVVYLTDADLYRPEREDATECWMRLLKATYHTRRRIGELSSTGQPRTFMADTYRLFCYSRSEGWLSAGAAAIGLDPLSSDGICFALRSGRNAAQAAAAYLNGDSAAVTNYSCSLDEYFNQYLAERFDYYSAETRWPRSPFWARRHQTPKCAA